MQRWEQMETVPSFVQFLEPQGIVPSAGHFGTIWDISGILGILWSNKYVVIVMGTVYEISRKKDFGHISCDYYKFC